MMRKDKGQESSGRTPMAEPLGTRTSNRISKFEQEVEQQLLPGIPNELTLDHIASKLSWRAIHTLPSVSRAWQLAIQNRQVYNARVRFNSTTTLVAVDHSVGAQSFIALYSMEERCFYFLPSIPHVDGGIPSLCQCVSLDGRLYVLGGRKKQHSLLKLGSQNVYVMDLVGRRQWRQCASMHKPRENFTCGVSDGKIYVFGGCSLGETVSLSEVYDPKVDAWSPIKSMLSLRRSNHVAAVGEELCVYGGGISIPDQVAELISPGLGKDFEFYHPVRDEWRKVDAFRRRNGTEIVFAAGGKFYSMTRLFINVRDGETGSWTVRNWFSFEALAPADLIDPIAVLAVDNELLALVRWCHSFPGSFRQIENETMGVSFLRSRGFGRENERILWDKVNSSLHFRRVFPFMYPVQL